MLSATTTEVNRLREESSATTTEVKRLREESSATITEVKRLGCEAWQRESGDSQLVGEKTSIAIHRGIYFSRKRARLALPAFLDISMLEISVYLNISG